VAKTEITDHRIKRCLGKWERLDVSDVEDKVWIALCRTCHHAWRQVDARYYGPACRGQGGGTPGSRRDVQKSRAGPNVRCIEQGSNSVLGHRLKKRLIGVSDAVMRCALEMPEGFGIQRWFAHVCSLLRLRYISCCAGL
jgi:hypothetical protein